MDRRLFLLSGLATSVTPAASAEYQCSPPDLYGNQICTAGIPSLRFFAARQLCDQWCWAACIQMIFATAGRLVPQEAIVMKLFGGLVCEPAPGGQAIIAAINGNWIDKNGYTFSAYSEPLLDLEAGYPNPRAAAAAAQELANGYPLINGALHHATVLTAMTYARDPYGNGQPLELTVRDPWPDSPSRRTLSMQEANSTTFLAAVRVS